MTRELTIEQVQEMLRQAEAEPNEDFYAHGVADLARAYLALAASAPQPTPAPMKYPGHTHMRLASLIARADREGGIDFVTPPSPPLAPIIDCAYLYGYTIAVHGSLHRDLDLIAVAWTPQAASPEELVDGLCSCAGLKVVGDWERKPHGRVGVILRQDAELASKPIDLSIMGPPLALDARRVTFNLNEYIYVRLTQKALDYLQARHELWVAQHGLNVDYVPPMPDENGYSGFQAWAFIEDFGPLFLNHMRRWEDWFEDDLNVQLDPKAFQESAALAEAGA